METILTAVYFFLEIHADIDVLLCLPWEFVASYEIKRNT